MNKKRIIPCLDIKDSRVVKGINFINLRDAGDPIETAKYYNLQNADELVLLDITATHENRHTKILDIVAKLANEITIPFTVGGGIKTIDDMRGILNAGAAKIAINTTAVLNKSLINQAAEEFGSKCMVVAIDAKREESSYAVYISGGRKRTDIDVIEWAIEAEKCGAGEILLTSIDNDGTRNGYDIELTNLVSSSVNIPVIASGGGGTLEHFYEVFIKGGADAALAATLFHYREVDIQNLKHYLNERGIEVKL